MPLFIAVDVCQKSPSDAANFVMEVVPLLTNPWQHHDVKVLEHVSLYLTRLKHLPRLQKKWMNFASMD